MAYFWIILIACLFAVCFLLIGKVAPEEYIRLLDNAGIILGYLITVLTVGAVIYGLIKQRQIKQWFKRPVFEGTGEEFQVPSEKVDAVIIPVSRREQPEWIIRHLRPRYVALLYTENSKNVAEKLIDDFKDICNFIPSKEEIQNSVHMITDPDDPAETRECTRRYIRQFFAKEINKENIFVDTTGGKVPMSIGAFQAAEEEGISSIYIVGGYKDRNRGFIIKDPRERNHGKPIFLSDRTG